MHDITTLITRIKSDYLDTRGVGIRHFSRMTNIRRTRLVKILDGSLHATVNEIDNIDIAITKIEENYHIRSSGI